MSSSSVGRRLEGKVAIVTGGASGIGASTVQLFHDNGAKVVIADIQDNLGQALSDKLNDNVCYIHCDVSDEDQVRTLVNDTVSKFGHLDIMYNNAGVMNGVFNSIVTTEKKDIERMLSVNLVASKYGIVGLTKNLAAELGFHGIRVNCISPFGVLTGSDIDETKEEYFEKMMSAVGNLKGNVLKAEDIAKAAVYLASDEACYVSGMNFVVDGGYSVVNPTLMKSLKAI
ncbi:hypothetical protein BUALT_Bualt09G0099100 [Buddleja alternifolia]|uniref:Uncharacterized protein n=1 Tax=Buddleja alternifolia TaxID=168488 RepID=A0AAV6X8N6_9LAMI|nr:hypothetical protein BUALT_Bualt09G0099100 [Buddleja alternifolia]